MTKPPLQARGSERTPRIRADARPIETSGDTGRNLVHAADHNLRITLEAIRRGGVLARPELARLTGLSVPGVSNILKQLAADGLVGETGRTGRAAGFGLVEDARFGLGLDVCAGQVTAVLADLAGRIVLLRRFAADDAGAAGELADAVRARAGSRPDRLVGCGIAIENGAHAAEAEALRLAAPLAALAKPAIASDTVAASLAELLFGGGREATFVSLFLGRTVTAGFVVDGRLFGGSRGRAGRIGRMRIDAEGADLDAIAAASTLPEAFRTGHEHKATDDPAFESWARDAVPHLMDAVVAVSGFLAPGTVFVGGRLPAPVLARIAERLTGERNKRMRDPLQPQWLPRIVPARLGADAAALGAAALPFLDRLLPDPRRR